MNQDQKIELGGYIVVVANTFKGTFDNTHGQNFIIAEMVLEKIHELTQNTPKTPEIIKNKSTRDEVDQHPKINKNKRHICGVCYTPHSTHDLSVDFGICPECLGKGYKKPTCNDIKGNMFTTGDVLINIDNNKTVKILQINKTHIVSEPGGITTRHQFRLSGWLLYK